MAMHDEKNILESRVVVLVKCQLPTGTWAWLSGGPEEQCLELWRVATQSTRADKEDGLALVRVDEDELEISTGVDLDDV